jgi:hypothetical protein
MLTAPSTAGWSAADFEENRRGRLSPDQLAELRRRMWVYVRNTFLWTTPLPLLALAGAIYGLIVQHEAGYFAIPVLFAALFSPLPIFVLIRASAVNADLKTGKVAEARGPIERMFINFRTGQGAVRIGGVHMECYGPLWQQAWRDGLHYLIQADRDGATLRAYYLPASRLFVAAEPGA